MINEEGDLKVLINFIPFSVYSVSLKYGRDLALWLI